MGTREKKKNARGGSCICLGFLISHPYSLLASHLSGFQGLSELEEVSDLETGPTVASRANRTNE